MELSTTARSAPSPRPPRAEANVYTVGTPIASTSVLTMGNGHISSHPDANGNVITPPEYATVDRNRDRNLPADQPPAYEEDAVVLPEYAQVDRNRVRTRDVTVGAAAWPASDQRPASVMEYEDNIDLYVGGGPDSGTSGTEAGGHSNEGYYNLGTATAGPSANADSGNGVGTRQAEGYYNLSPESSEAGGYENFPTGAAAGAGAAGTSAEGYYNLPNGKPNPKPKKKPKPLARN